MPISTMPLPQGWHLLPIVDTISSTNTWLKEHAQCLQDQTILIAREQTQGRGRSDRRFYSAKDKGLYLSVLLTDRITELSLTKLTALCALALQHAIQACSQLITQIKWVNDILYRDHKLAGILCEAVYEGTRPTACIIGFGVNVYSQEFPSMDNQPAAIADFSPIAPSMHTLIYALIQQLDLCLRNMEDPRLMEEYRSLSATLHRMVQVQEGNRCYRAYAEAIDEDGALWVRTETGRRQLRSGAVSIRPCSE